MDYINYITSGVWTKAPPTPRKSDPSGNEEVTEKPALLPSGFLEASSLKSYINDLLCQSFVQDSSFYSAIAQFESNFAQASTLKELFLKEDKSYISGPSFLALPKELKTFIEDVCKAADLTALQDVCENFQQDQEVFIQSSEDKTLIESFIAKVLAANKTAKKKIDDLKPLTSTPQTPDRKALFDAFKAEAKKLYAESDATMKEQVEALVTAAENAPLPLEANQNQLRQVFQKKAEELCQKLKTGTSISTIRAEIKGLLVEIRNETKTAEENNFATSFQDGLKKIVEDVLEKNKAKMTLGKKVSIERKKNREAVTDRESAFSKAANLCLAQINGELELKALIQDLEDKLIALEKSLAEESKTLSTEFSDSLSFPIEMKEFLKNIAKLSTPTFIGITVGIVVEQDLKCLQTLCENFKIHLENQGKASPFKQIIENFIQNVSKEKNPAKAQETCLLFTKEIALIAKAQEISAELKGQDVYFLPIHNPSLIPNPMVASTNAPILLRIDRKKKEIIIINPENDQGQSLTKHTKRDEILLSAVKKFPLTIIKNIDLKKLDSPEFTQMLVMLNNRLEKGTLVNADAVIHGSIIPFLNAKVDGNASQKASDLWFKKAKDSSEEKSFFTTLHCELLLEAESQKINSSEAKILYKQVLFLYKKSKLQALLTSNPMNEPNPYRHLSPVSDVQKFRHTTAKLFALSGISPQEFEETNALIDNFIKQIPPKDLESSQLHAAIINGCDIETTDLPRATGQISHLGLKSQDFLNTSSDVTPESFGKMTVTENSNTTAFSTLKQESFYTFDINKSPLATLQEIKTAFQETLAQYETEKAEIKRAKYHLNLRQEKELNNKHFFSLHAKYLDLISQIPLPKQGEPCEFWDRLLPGQHEAALEALTDLSRDWFSQQKIHQEKANGNQAQFEQSPEEEYHTLLISHAFLILGEYIAKKDDANQLKGFELSPRHLVNALNGAYTTSKGKTFWDHTLNSNYYYQNSNSQNSSYYHVSCNPQAMELHMRLFAYYDKDYHIGKKGDEYPEQTFDILNISCLNKLEKKLSDYFTSLGEGTLLDESTIENIKVFMTFDTDLQIQPRHIDYLAQFLEEDDSFIEEDSDYTGLPSVRMLFGNKTPILPFQAKIAKLIKENKIPKQVHCLQQLALLADLQTMQSSCNQKDYNNRALYSQVSAVEWDIGSTPFGFFHKSAVQLATVYRESVIKVLDALKMPENLTERVRDWLEQNSLTSEDYPVHAKLKQGRNKDQTIPAPLPDDPFFDHKNWSQTFFRQEWWGSSSSFFDQEARFPYLSESKQKEAFLLAHDPFHEVQNALSFTLENLDQFLQFHPHLYAHLFKPGRLQTALKQDPNLCNTIANFFNTASQEFEMQSKQNELEKLYELREQVRNALVAFCPPEALDKFPPLDASAHAPLGSQQVQVQYLGENQTLNTLLYWPKNLQKHGSDFIQPDTNIRISFPKEAPGQFQITKKVDEKNYFYLGITGYSSGVSADRNISEDVQKLFFNAARNTASLPSSASFLQVWIEEAPENQRQRTVLFYGVNGEPQKFILEKSDDGAYKIYPFQNPEEIPLPEQTKKLLAPITTTPEESSFDSFARAAGLGPNNSFVNAGIFFDEESQESEARRDLKASLLSYQKKTIQSVTAGDQTFSYQEIQEGQFRKCFKLASENYPGYFVCEGLISDLLPKNTLILQNKDGQIKYLFLDEKNLIEIDSTKEGKLKPANLISQLSLASLYMKKSMVKEAHEQLPSFEYPYSKEETLFIETLTAQYLPTISGEMSHLLLRQNKEAKIAEQEKQAFGLQLYIRLVKNYDKYAQESSGTLLKGLPANALYAYISYTTQMQHLGEHTLNRLQECRLLNHFAEITQEKLLDVSYLKKISIINTLLQNFNLKNVASTLIRNFPPAKVVFSSMGMSATPIDTTILSFIQERLDILESGLSHETHQTRSSNFSIEIPNMIPILMKLLGILFRVGLKESMTHSLKHYDPNYIASPLLFCQEDFSLKKNFMSLYNIAKNQDPEQIKRLKNYLTANRPFLAADESLVLILEAAVYHPYTMPSVDSIQKALNPLLLWEGYNQTLTVFETSINPGKITDAMMEDLRQTMPGLISESKAEELPSEGAIVADGKRTAIEIAMQMVLKAPYLSKKEVEKLEKLTISNNSLQHSKVNSLQWPWNYYTNTLENKITELKEKQRRIQFLLETEKARKESEARVIALLQKRTQTPFIHLTTELVNTLKQEDSSLPWKNNPDTGSKVPLTEAVEILLRDTDLKSLQYAELHQLEQELSAMKKPQTRYGKGFHASKDIPDLIAKEEAKKTKIDEETPKLREALQAKKDAIDTETESFISAKTAEIQQHLETLKTHTEWNEQHKLREKIRQAQTEIHRQTEKQRYIELELRNFPQIQQHKKSAIDEEIRELGFEKELQDLQATIAEPQDRIKPLQAKQKKYEAAQKEFTQKLAAKLLWAERFYNLTCLPLNLYNILTSVGGKIGHMALQSLSQTGIAIRSTFEHQYKLFMRNKVQILPSLSYEEAIKPDRITSPIVLDTTELKKIDAEFDRNLLALGEKFLQETMTTTNRERRDLPTQKLGQKELDSLEKDTEAFYAKPKEEVTYRIKSDINARSGVLQPYQNGNTGLDPEKTQIAAFELELKELFEQTASDVDTCKKELLELANKLTGAKVLTVLDLQALLLKGCKDQVQKKTHLKETDVDLLIEKLGLYLTKNTRLHQIQIIHDKVKKFAKDPSDLVLLDSVGSLLQLGRNYDINTENRFFILFENTKRVLLRKNQTDKIEEIHRVLKSTYKAVVANMETGFSKTFFILKEIAQSFWSIAQEKDHEKSIVFYTNPYSLDKINAEDQHTTRQEMQKGRTDYLEFSREMHLSPDALHAQYLQLLEDMREGHPVTMTSESARGLQNIFLLNFHALMDSRTQNTEELERKAVELRNILALIRKRGKVVIDEGDQILSPDHQEQFPILQKQSMQNYEIETISLFFSLLSPEAMSRIDNNDQSHFSKEENKKEFQALIIQPLLENVMNHYEITSEQEQQDFKDFVAGKGTPKEWILNHPEKQALSLMKGLFLCICPHALTSDVGEDFGRSELHKNKASYAIPYHSGTAVENEKNYSVIQNHHEALVKTMISYLHLGIDEEQAFNLIQHLQKEAMSEYQNSKKLTPIAKTKAYKIFEEMLPEATGRFICMADKEMKSYALDIALNKNHRAIRAYVDLFVAQKIDIYAKTASADAQNFLSMFESSFSVSATTQDKDAILASKTWFIDMPGILGPAVGIYREQCRKEDAIHALSGKTSRDFLDSKELAELMKKPDSKALVDAGGLLKGINDKEVVKKLNELLQKNISEILYFDSEKRTFLSYNRTTGTSTLPNPDADLSKRFIYYNQSHSIGSDLKLLDDPSTLGFVTVGSKTSLVAFIQARGRLRGINSKQRLNLILPQELAGTLGKDGKIPTADDVLGHLCQNEKIRIENYNFDAIKQQIQNVLRSSLLDIILDLDSNKPSVSRMKWLFKCFEDELLTTIDIDPYSMYALIQDGINPRDALLSHIARCESKINTLSGLSHTDKQKIHEKLNPYKDFIAKLTPETFTLGTSTLDSVAGIGKTCQVEQKIEVTVETENEQETAVKRQEIGIQRRYQLNWGADKNFDLFTHNTWFIAKKETFFQQAYVLSAIAYKSLGKMRLIVDIATVAVWHTAAVVVVEYTILLQFLIGMVALDCLGLHPVASVILSPFVMTAINAQLMNLRARVHNLVSKYFKKIKTVPVMSVHDALKMAFPSKKMHRLFKHLNVTANFWDILNQRASHPEANAIIEFLKGVVLDSPDMKQKLEVFPETPFQREQKPFNQVLVVEHKTFFGERKCTVMLIDTKEAEFFARKILEDQEADLAAAELAKQEAEKVLADEPSAFARKILENKKKAKEQALREIKEKRNKIALFDLSTNEFTDQSAGFSIDEIKRSQVFKESVCEAKLIQSVLKETFCIFNNSDEHRHKAVDKVEEVGERALLDLINYIPKTDGASLSESALEQEVKARMKRISSEQAGSSRSESTFNSLIKGILPKYLRTM